MEFLEGKKTYIVAFSAIVAVVADAFFGVDIPELSPEGNTLEYLVGLVLIITTRAGITKSGSD